MFLREVSYQGCTYLIKNTLKLLYCYNMHNYLYISQCLKGSNVSYKGVKYDAIVYYFFKWLLQNILNGVHSLVKNTCTIYYTALFYTTIILLRCFISAVKRLIASKIKVCVYIINECTVYIYYVYTIEYIYTKYIQTVYILKIFTCVYTFIYLYYI